VLALARAFFPDYVFHWDEVQLTLALERFDLRSHQPHPPGYYLFVALGRLLRPLVAAPENALRSLAAAGCAAFVPLVAAALPAAARPLARALHVVAAAAFVACSPLALLHAVSASTYTVEAACWLGILLALARRPAGGRLGVLGAGIGLAGGIRPTLIVWGLVAAALVWLGDHDWPGRRAAPRAFAALALGAAAWAVPLLLEAGGPRAYLAAAGPTLVGNIWEKSVFHEGLAAAMTRLARLTADLALALGPLLAASGVALVARLRPRWRARLAPLDLLLVGAAIPFLFYVLLIYDSDGYVLAVALPLAAHGLCAVATLLAGLRLRDQLVGAGAVLALALVAWPSGAAFAPARGHRVLAAHDADVAARVGAIRRGFKPAETVLVTSHEYWAWGLRHVMYYLPEYTTVQLIPDRFYAAAGPETPYLTAREHRIAVAGPDGLSLGSLGASVRDIVYMIPHDVNTFITASCGPYLRRLPTRPGESLPVLRLGPQLDVRVERAQLHCARPGTRPAPSTG